LRAHLLSGGHSMRVSLYATTTLSGHPRPPQPSSRNLSVRSRRTVLSFPPLKARSQYLRLEALPRVSRASATRSSRRPARRDPHAAQRSGGGIRGVWAI
ncbi:MAG: hypothetical protein GSR80_000801, partial [Desulfurococcales archaeon]|nr:hypothetical protein [Desulfurococcales archaeon]